jgi:hypothetical protein
VKLRTAKKKFRAELKEITDWLKRERNRLKTGEVLRQAKSGFGGLPFEAVICDYEHPGRDHPKPGHRCQQQQSEWLRRRRRVSVLDY